MANRAIAVVRATLSATLNGTIDFTKAGFGTVAAAIIFFSNANSTSNPQANAVLSIGFWDGTNQRSVGVFAQDNVADANTARASDDSYGGIAAGATNDTDYAVSAITDGIRLTLSVDNTTVERFCTVILFAGVDAEVDTFVMGLAQNADRTVDTKTVPDLIFFATIGDTVVDVSGQTNAIISFGFAARNGTQRMLAWSAADAAAAEDLNLLFSETRAVGQVLGGALTWSGEVVSVGPDSSFVIRTKDGASGGDLCFYLALTGVSFDCGTLTTRTTTGVDTIDTGITPEVVLLALSTATGTTLHTDSGANGVMVGLADANGQFSHNISVEDGAATTNANSAAQAAQILDLDSSSAGTRSDLVDATVGFSTNPNFTLNYSAVNATARKGFWIAFEVTPEISVAVLAGQSQIIGAGVAGGISCA